MQRRRAFKHGTRSTYANYKCRCLKCRAANTAYQKTLVRRLQLGPIPDRVKHGTINCYKTWGCRCEPCRGAARIDNKYHYDRRKAAGYRKPR